MTQEHKTHWEVNLKSPDGERFHLSNTPPKLIESLLKIFFPSHYHTKSRRVTNDLQRQ